MLLASTNYLAPIERGFHSSSELKHFYCLVITYLLISQSEMSGHCAEPLPVMIMRRKKMLGLSGLRIVENIEVTANFRTYLSI